MLEGRGLMRVLAGHAQAVASCTCDWPQALLCVTGKEEERDFWFTWTGGVRSLGRKRVWQRKREARHHDRHPPTCITKCATRRTHQDNVRFRCKSSKFKVNLAISSHIFCFVFISLCRSSVGSALPRRRCCAYITIGMICIFIGVGLTVSNLSVFLVLLREDRSFLCNAKQRFTLWLSSASTGWHSGLCKSLQRHLRIMGICLPAGPHLPDTSLLLGHYQSQLPREQLRLEWPPHGPGLHSWKDKPHFHSFSSWFSNHSCSAGGVEHLCVWRGVFWRGVLYVGDVPCGVCEMFQAMPTRWVRT